jgi:predicted MFS family arabinose efflux permease
LAGTAPLAYAINAYGWRETIWGLSIAALFVALALFIVLKDPPRSDDQATQEGNLLSLLTDRNLLLLFPLMLMSYAPAAGLRGLWVGPYFENVFGLGQVEIGRVTMAMAIAMILGSFAYGLVERVLGSKKLVIIIGNLCVVLSCLALWFIPGESWRLSLVLFTVIGFFGMSYPAMMAHGQMFLPRHLTGRGMTLLNLLGIGGVGLMQFVTSAMARAVPVQESLASEFYGSVFLLFGMSLLVGCVIYGFTIERKVEYLDTQTD